ncbi:MAG TPA: isoprenylcysteine carboxylmethyltransferase family protein [Terracidiphilus sp.]|nr:isoprenylcysteine carboxylmethyltransferase family protein [Terracidiphilus sp.]
MRLSTPLEIAAWVVLGICWIAWMLAFVRPRQNAAGAKKAVRAPSSRWGILLVMLGYACEFTFVFPKGFHKSEASLIASMVVGPLSVVLIWLATRHLDKQWRFEAALSEDHELITTGPYRWVRNPIYTSMFGMLLETGLVKAWWPLLVSGIVFYIVGTEIRVRAEERLLEQRFGENFARYKAQTPAYVPFLR